MPGGTGRYSAELATALARVAAPGDGVGGWCAWHRDVGAAALPGLGAPLRLALPRRPLAAAWQRGTGPTPTGVDVVHAPTLLVPPKRPGVALVVTIHDAVPWTHPETLTPHGVRWHVEMGQRAARHADAVVVPTRAVAAALRAHLPIGDDRLHVVGEGVAAAVGRLPGKLDADARARRLGLPAGGYLLTLATLEPRKGLDTALAALCEPGCPDLPLLHVGPSGWGGLDLGQEAARLGVRPGRFRSLGRIDDTDLAIVLSRASLLLAPSRSEGFGLPVLEALSHGVPAVVSDVPALVEVGGDGVVVVPVDDPPALAAAAAEVLGDPALRQRLSVAGRLRAGDFTWNEAARACWSLYRRDSGNPAVSATENGRA